MTYRNLCVIANKVLGNGSHIVDDTLYFSGGDNFVSFSAVDGYGIVFELIVTENLITAQRYCAALDKVTLDIWNFTPDLTEFRFACSKEAKVGGFEVR